jgi:tRNA U34 5-carboxymethylaminomethyl modifying enzyme MnmG/GidA
MRIHPILLVLVIISLVACTQTSESNSAAVEPTRLPSATVARIQSTETPLSDLATQTTQAAPPKSISMSEQAPRQRGMPCSAMHKLQSRLLIILTSSEGTVPSTCWKLNRN